MKKLNKKAFTIVELIVVIVIIGILAAILIPNVVKYIDQTKVIKDKELVSNLNKALAYDRLEKGIEIHETPTAALEAAQAHGYNVAVINKTSKDGNEILWDSVNDVYLYLEDGTKSYVPDFEPKKSVKDSQIWKISNTIDEQYATYYTGTETTVTVDKGFDAGESAVTSISLVRTASIEHDVVIRTNSFATTLTINAPADTVNHYGNAAIVNVEKIAGASYHENGTVGRLTVEEGHAVAEANATIFCFIDAGSDTTATVEVKSGAVVYDKNGENKGQEAVVEGTHDDCGAGHHDFGTQLVIDNKVYEVCKSCGYTLVTVVDLAGNETKVTMVDDEGEIVNTPIETYNSSATNDAGQVIEGKEDPVVETPTVVKSDDVTCTHNFVSTISIEATCTQTGVKTYTCSKCGMSYTSSIPMKAHSYYDHVGAAHTADETCSVCGHVRGDKVAEVNGVQYTTLTDAIAAVPTDGTQTLITLINDDAIEGNEGWTIAATQNIVLDLNGYTLKNLVTEDKGSQVINNKGTLVIKDSSDLNKDGTGTGVIFNQAKEGVHVGEWWGTVQYNYVTNSITNRGKLTIQSGKIMNTCAGSICYAVDTASGDEVTINGGHLSHVIDNVKGTAIRVAAGYHGSTNAIFTMNGGTVNGGYCAIWLQLPSSSGNTGAILTFNDGNVIANAEKGYAFYDYSSGQSYEKCEYHINNGTFNGNIYTYGVPVFEISGGTINGTVISPKNINKTGGTISGEFHENYILLDVYFGSEYTVEAVVGEDYVLDAGYDLSDKIVTAQYYNGTNEIIDSSKISINGSVITIDKSALHEFTGGDFCIWIKVTDAE